MRKSIISVTKSASKKLIEISRTNNSIGLLFFIKSGGCNGFEYRFEPIKEIAHKENVFKKDELIIEVCNKSLLYLIGTKIDWNEDIMGQGFKFENPIAQSSCGCGSSFNPKV